MGKLEESINKLVIDTWGGLIAFWTLIVAVFYKFFMFLGECMAEGVATKQTNKMMPVIKEQIKEEIAPLKQDVCDLKKLIPEYKKEKHSIDGQLKQIKRVIADDDKEILKELKILIKKEYEDKQP